jgi:hypothetical protein
MWRRSAKKLRRLHFSTLQGLIRGSYCRNKPKYQAAGIACFPITDGRSEQRFDVRVASWGLMTFAFTIFGMKRLAG